MTTQPNSEFFSDFDIDQIQVNTASNFFIPVLLDVYRYIGPQQNICDVGCGNGIFSASLSSMFNSSVTGVDGNKHALDLAKSYDFKQLSYVHDFSTDKLPLEKNQFDLVICKDVLEHLLYPQNLVAEMSRVTVSGGYLLVLVPNHFSLLGRLHLLFFNNLDPFSYFPSSNRANFPHIRFFDRRDLLSMIGEHSFVPVLPLSHHFPIFSIFRHILPSRLKRIISSNFPDLFAEAHVYLFKKQ